MDHPLKAYRTECGMTLDEAAAAIGDVTAAQISRIENRKTSPSADLMRRIAMWSGGRVTPNDLLGVEAAA